MGGFQVATAGGVWVAVGAYNPMAVLQIPEITRVYYTYCKKGDDGPTTVMRIRLADAILPAEDIIYYT